MRNRVMCLVDHDEMRNRQLYAIRFDGPDQQTRDGGHLHRRLRAQRVLGASHDHAAVNTMRREFGGGLIDDLASMRDHQYVLELGDVAPDDLGEDDGLTGSGGRNDQRPCGGAKQLLDAIGSIDLVGAQNDHHAPPLRALRTASIAASAELKEPSRLPRRSSASKISPRWQISPSLSGVSSASRRSS